MTAKDVSHSDQTTDSTEFTGPLLGEKTTHTLGVNLGSLPKKSTPQLGDPDTREFFEDLTDRALSEDEPYLSYPAVDRAFIIWMDLNKALSERGIYEAPQPTIGVDRSGRILMSWRLDNAYLECEIPGSEIQSIETETFYEGAKTDRPEMETFPAFGVGSSEGDWLAKRIASYL